MASYNKVIMLGNLTRDPQLSYTPSQTAVVDTGLATNRKFTTKDGEKKEDTCFIDIRAFGKSAEAISKYRKKGEPLLVEGHLVFEHWEDSEKKKHSRNRLIVDKFQFINFAKNPAGTANAEQQAESAEIAGGGDGIPF